MSVLKKSEFPLVLNFKRKMVRYDFFRIDDILVMLKSREILNRISQ